jgi:hypothetical protein
VDRVADPSKLRERLVGTYGAGVDFIALAAIGITRQGWRSDWHGYVEDAHAGAGLGRRSRITDGEMFAANVATTRLVLQHVRQFPAVDWEALADAFTDPCRIAGQRTLVDLLGKVRYRRWSHWAWNHIAAMEIRICAHGTEEVLLAYATEGTHYDDWWAGPRWPGLVEAFINQLATSPPTMTKRALCEQLLSAPDSLDPNVLEWCATDQRLRYTTDRRQIEKTTQFR